ncbi:MAG: hypothetical protein WCD89_08635 [Anaerocolumna sp.]
MDWIKQASWYILGSEEFVSSNSIMATVVMKAKLDTKKLFPGYRELILRNPLLQTKIIDQPKKDSFEWGRFSREELEELLCFEEGQLSKKFTMEELLAQYETTNSRLPFCFSVIDECTLQFFMNHVVTHGRGMIFWIQEWLQYYSGEKEEKRTSYSSYKDGILRALKRVGAFFWMPFFTQDFVKRALKVTADDTVDLSYGNKPERNGSYVKKSYRFGEPETSEILHQCRLKKMTVTEYLCFQLIRGLFQYDSQKKRVLVAMPMDIQSFYPYSPETMCGNFIGALPAQFFRDGDLEKQVKSVFKWFKRGIPYSLLAVASFFLRSYKKLKKSCQERCEKPMPERAPLGNYSVYFSNIGIVSYPIMERHVESICFSLKTQFVMISASTISGRLMMEICISEKLYDPVKVFQLFDRILSLDYLLNNDNTHL